METHAEPGLRELSDPEFFARWSRVRQRYAVAPPGGRERAEIGGQYEAMRAEFLRRLDGGS